MKYLTCLSTSTSNDKLAFDVGLQVHSQGFFIYNAISPVVDRLFWINLSFIYITKKANPAGGPFIQPRSRDPKEKKFESVTI